MFPKPGTAEFDEFVRKMEELSELLTDPKECFRRAETCEQRARNSKDKKQRDGLLWLAQRWRTLGIHYEIKAKFPLKP
jgi:predicted nicotinamide N-methyase